MWKFFLSTLLVAAAFDWATAKGLPSYLKICKRDPNIEQCIVDNVDILRPKMKQGIPELFVPPLDPLVIPEATLNSGDSFSAVFKDIQLYHVDDFHLESFKLDLDQYRIDIKISFPKLRIKSIYNIKGRLLILNLDGKGPADGNYTNVQAMATLKGKPFQKNNKEFIRWEKEKIDIHIDKIHLLFERIFGDNQELNERTNKVINDNIDSIVEELLPLVQQIVSNFIFNVINRLFGRYPINELFPKA